MLFKNLNETSVAGLNENNEERSHKANFPESMQYIQESIQKKNKEKQEQKTKTIEKQIQK